MNVSFLCPHFALFHARVHKRHTSELFGLAFCKMSHKRIGEEGESSVDTFTEKTWKGEAKVVGGSFIYYHRHLLYAV